MHKLILNVLIPATVIALISCSGSTAPTGQPGDGQNDELPKLQYDLVVNPGSPVSAAEVDGQMVTIDDALAARQTSSLPDGFVPMQGMQFTPNILPGAGFSAVLTVKLTMGDPSPSQYDGVRLFLFLIHPETFEPIPVDSARAFSNWLSFDINSLGYFIIAENSAIPRPGTVYTVSGFADLAETSVGTPISFWAFASNGIPPYQFAWEFGDGNSGTGATITHSYTQAGEFEVQLVATDALGDSVPAVSTPITISANPVPLGAVVVSVMPQSGVPLEYVFSATTSGGNPPLTYDWDFDGDGTTDSTDSPPVVHAYATNGLYGGSLTVSDLVGDESRAEFIVDSRELVLEADAAFGQAPYSASFSLNSLGLGDGAEITVIFDDGEELEAAGSEFTHIFAVPGTYSVQATVTETVLETDIELFSNSVDIVVTDGPLPQIAAMSPNEGPVGTVVTMIGFHFGDFQEDGVVLLGIQEQQINQWSDSRIIFEIMADSVDGAITIERDGKVSNPRDFDVLPRSPDEPGGGQI